MGDPNVIVVVRKLKMAYFLCLILIASEASSAQPKLPARATGATENVFAAAPDAIYHVDPINGNDNLGTGVSNRPVRTLGRALEFAKRSYARGSKVRIELAPGDYREEGFFEMGNPNANAYLHLVAKQPGTAVITGFDNWTGDGRNAQPWQREADGAYSKPWIRDWGFATEGIAHGPDREFDRSLIARREAVTMDRKQTLRQVLTRNQLTPGTFFVDDFNRQLYLRPPTGKDPNRNLTEVAVRPHRNPYQGWLWTFWNIQNLKIDGLVFTGAASFPNGANLHVARECKNVVIEDCIFKNNGSGGFNLEANDPQVPSQFQGVTDVTVRNCLVTENGTYGFSGGFNNGLFVGNQFTRNNVRGDWAGYTGWSIAGAKFVLVNRCTLQSNLITKNRTGGLWFDIHCRDAWVKDCKITDNVGKKANGEIDERGVFFEISEGPLLIEDCDVSRNAIGIQIGNCSDTTIRNCKITDNLITQIGLEGRPRGDEFPPHNERLIIEDNQISANKIESFLVREIWSQGEENVQRSVPGLHETTMRNNRYRHPCPSEAFVGMDLVQDEHRWQPMTFDRWKRLMKLDQNGSTINGRSSLGGVSGCTISTEQFDQSNGVTAFEGGIGDLGFQEGQADWVCYRNFDFAKASNQVTLTVGVPAENAGGVVELRTGSIDGPILTAIEIASTGGWDKRQEQSHEITPISGIHDLFLVVQSGYVVGNLYEIRFSRQ
ncbi:Endo-1,4-beta-xylanase Z precursor [Rubripirellula obstinata]|uniref:Endo-1,4-beta-xylanase Z n=1 Tax=Rubripirellula obstinata TaxID=406547 RepID=A0A5B1CLG9_9BACT|nr:right-handed parallel beta-helix repeat-containing protein [Rubripirellula obstinata]KAA1260213.1 Endo-1,4-beta-xylanase Z precursor [Rubripirellula obstinata]